VRQSRKGARVITKAYLVAAVLGLLHLLLVGLLVLLIHTLKLGLLGLDLRKTKTLVSYMPAAVLW
jgi:hypothetical protein